jgi:hypothetical protein
MRSYAFWTKFVRSHTRISTRRGAASAVTKNMQPHILFLLKPACTVSSRTGGHYATTGSMSCFESMPAQCGERTDTGILLRLAYDHEISRKPSKSSSTPGRSSRISTKNKSKMLWKT